LINLQSLSHVQPLPIRAAADILSFLARPQYRDIFLHVSCFEIYGNKTFDLLNARKRLNILEDGKRQVCVCVCVWIVACKHV